MENSRRYERQVDVIAVLAKANRERERTASGNTVTPVSRWWLILFGLVIAATGCGGSAKPKGDMYARANNEQAACCENLHGAPRDECLAKLVTVNDPAVVSTELNQETYACVSEHFACDPTTGHATQASAQSQLDCIQDLQQ